MLRAKCFLRRTRRRKKRIGIYSRPAGRELSRLLDISCAFGAEISSFVVLKKQQKAGLCECTAPLGGLWGLHLQIILHQHLQQLIAVDLADQRAGRIVVGDIGGILGEDIAHDLVDRIVALLLEGLLDSGEDMMDLLLLILSGIELSGKLIHADTTLPRDISSIRYKRARVKR